MPIPLGVLAVAGAGAAGAAGAYDLLETTLISTNTASVTFSGLGSYSDYKHLQIRLLARASNDNSNVLMRFNADTGSNYALHGLYGSSSSVLSFASTSQTYIVAGESSLNSHAANSFSPAVTDILDFSSTSKNKTVRTFSGNQIETFIALRSGLWMSLNAVTSISLFLNSGSFVAGSRFSLYGIK